MLKGILAVLLSAALGAAVLLPVRGAPHVFVGAGDVVPSASPSGVAGGPSPSSSSGNAAPPGQAHSQTPAPGTPRNARVTDDGGGRYLRADGRTDGVMDACGNGRREQNEP